MLKKQNKNYFVYTETEKNQNQLIFKRSMKIKLHIKKLKSNFIF